jgi:hypothetical protein
MLGASVRAGLCRASSRAESLRSTGSPHGGTAKALGFPCAGGFATVTPALPHRKRLTEPRSWFHAGVQPPAHAAGLLRRQEFSVAGAGVHQSRDMNMGRDTDHGRPSSIARCADVGPGKDGRFGRAWGTVTIDEALSKLCVDSGYVAIVAGTSQQALPGPHNGRAPEDGFPAHVAQGGWLSCTCRAGRMASLRMSRREDGFPAHVAQPGRCPYFVGFAGSDGASSATRRSCNSSRLRWK